MARKGRRPPSGHNILVVDDQEDLLLSVRALLAREGHSVLTAKSGPEALVMLRDNDVHLMLVDYFMPRMTGDELIREVRRFDPLVQIVLQTGYAGEKPPRQMLAELDIQGYHDKASGPEDLLLWVDVGLKAHGMLRRLKERERLQAELVANVSHEFRTPLNVISGYTDLLIDGAFGSIGAEALQPLNRVEEACRNLAELVDDFLRYARVEARVEGVAERWIETTSLTGELERLAGVLLDGREVVFEVDVTRAPRGFFTDSVKMRTVLRNLIANAAKFTTSGFIRLRIAQDNGSLALSVEDSGPGIPADDLEVIFEPFRQLDGSLTRVHGGIGLGLALSRKLARLLGGDLVVTSEVGKGSMFTLVLPRAALQERALSEQETHDVAMAQERAVSPHGLLSG